MMMMEIQIVTISPGLGKKAMMDFRHPEVSGRFLWKNPVLGTTHVHVEIYMVLRMYLTLLK